MVSWKPFLWRPYFNTFVSSESLQKCSKCSQTAYCSNTCQQMDWNAGHRLEECNYLRLMKEKNIPVDTDFRLLLRFVLKVELMPNVLSREFLLYDGQKKKLADLESHSSDFKRDYSFICTLGEIAKRFIQIGLKLDQEELLERFGQTTTNQFGIYAPGNLHNKKNKSRIGLNSCKCSIA